MRTVRVLREDESPFRAILTGETPRPMHPHTHPRDFTPDHPDTRPMNCLFVGFVDTDALRVYHPPLARMS